MALDILIAPAGSPEHKKALREAALSANIFREIWEKDGPGLSSDENMRYHLAKERGFSASVCGQIISWFRATIAYARVDDELKCAQGVAGGSGGTSYAIGGGGAAPTLGAQETPAAGPSGTLPITILMNDGTVRVVSVPKMTEAAFAFFKNQLELFRSAIVLGADGKKASDS